MQEYLTIKLLPNDVSIIRAALQEWKGKFPLDSEYAHEIDSYVYLKAKEAGWNPTNHNNE